MYNQKRFTHRKEGYGVTTFDILTDGSVIKVKDADDAQWAVGQAYVRDDDEKTVYIRSGLDFLNRFEPEQPE